eukprot:1192718-Prorocentrum_minimum.AAC.3
MDRIMLPKQYFNNSTTRGAQTTSPYAGALAPPLLTLGPESIRVIIHRFRTGRYEKEGVVQKAHSNGKLSVRISWQILEHLHVCYEHFQGVQAVRVHGEIARGER